MAYENVTPAYWVPVGGAHLILRCGVEASAVRGTKDDCWTIFAPDGSQSFLTSTITEKGVKALLKSLVRQALIEALAELEGI